MSLNHPEMLELSGKRFSVLYTERYDVLLYIYSIKAIFTDVINTVLS